MNKKLVAQFLASVDPYTLPTNSFDLSELDEFEVEELLSQAVEFDHNGRVMYVIPGVTYDGDIQNLECYVFDDGELMYSDYTPTYAELSDILEHQEWYGDWVNSEDVQEAMKRIPAE